MKLKKYVEIQGTTQWWFDRINMSLNDQIDMYLNIFKGGGGIRTFAEQVYKGVKEGVQEIL